MCKLRVLFAQLPVPNNPALNTPLAAGYLVAYALAQGLGDRADFAILPRALADHAGDAALVAAIVAHAPDLLALSLYTWNSERSLQIAARVRAQLPRLCVVVGGPEVQADNLWVIEHAAVDVAVIGEGEQSFVALLNALAAEQPLDAIPGLAWRTPSGTVRLNPERVALQSLESIPSPYLSGLLDDIPSDGMLMVEVSRWCPYSCSFCLYGRNMGPRLGNRYFGLERLLAEIVWGKARGLRTVHFVEANLNLVPIFWPLMHALADLNADRQLTFYAELRAEHLSDEVVAALVAANVRVVEVGLQTANPVALRASQRRTDLHKWAAGTRRLYAAGIEVLLDVILGLPADTADGVATTLAFLQREQLGSYDIFTLQVLPGTAVRREAAQYGLRYQERPPYYVLATNSASYRELRTLRRNLKDHAGLDPDAIEGMPLPRQDAFTPRAAVDPEPVDQIWGAAALAQIATDQLAAHVDVCLEHTELAAATPALARLISANPHTIIDLYLVCDHPPTPAELQTWRTDLPFTPGYLDRVAVYRAEQPAPPWQRESPRIWLVLPWSCLAEPADYATVANIIWMFEHTAGTELPFGAWRAAGGAGIYLRTMHPLSAAEVQAITAWAAAEGRMIWWGGAQ
jgi:radical SAM superfamily enzyme YgiQ (UPF0313 family)